VKYVVCARRLFNLELVCTGLGFEGHAGKRLAMISVDAMSMFASNKIYVKETPLGRSLFLI
jgi:hypothetical protein